MFFSRVNLCLLLLVSLFHATHSVAQSRENIVLLPIEVSPEYANQKDLLGGALQKSLSQKYNVFYGSKVEEALEAEYAKEDCTAVSCVQNIAIIFNGEIVVDASVQLVEESTFLRVQFQNVITGELEAIVQDSCGECSFTQLIDFIDERASDITLNSSQGLTALLEKQAEPVKPLVATPQREQAKPSVTVSQGPINPRPKPTNSQPKVAKSSSYWKWGLGALVLGAAGGGGGGGGGGSYGGSGSDGGSGGTSAATNITPFDTPGAAFIDSQNLLGGSYTYIAMPPQDHTKFYQLTYKYGGNGRLPEIKTLGGVTRRYAGIDNLFRFQVEGGVIKRLAMLNSGPDFDVADGANIRPYLDDQPQLSYFTNTDGDEFLGLSLTRDYEDKVNGIARTFFGVVEYDVSQSSDYDRLVLAYHAGQPAPDARVPTSGEVEFSGFSAGQWVPHNDVSSWTTSEIEVSVDFDSARAELASSNTQISSNPGQSGSWTSHGDLNFNVEGSVRDGPKRIRADSTNADGDILPTLSVDGQAEGGAWSAFFYEENSAIETSGTFTFHRGDSDRGDKYIGAFGARRE